jgi:hypothetical protein
MSKKPVKQPRKPKEPDTRTQKDSPKKIKTN